MDRARAGAKGAGKQRPYDVAHGDGAGQRQPVTPRFKYALILSISCALLHLVLFFSGFETVRLDVGHHLFWLHQVFIFVVLWLGIREARYASPKGGLSYGRAVWTGVVISFYSALMSAVYDFIHFTWINPHFSDAMIAWKKPQWAAAGMTAAEMDTQTKHLMFFMSPLPHAAIFISATVLFGLVLSLIIAAFLRHPAFAGTSPPLRST